MAQRRQRAAGRAGAGGPHLGPGRAGQAQQTQRQGDGQHHRGGLQPGGGGQHAGGDHAGQCQAFAPGHDARPLRRQPAEPGAPALVQHRQQAVAQVAAGQHQAAPGQQRPGALHRWKEQALEAQRQQQRRPSGQQGQWAQPAVHAAVHQAAQEGVGQRVQRAGGQQQQAQAGQRHAQAAAVVVGQQHIQRQGHEGQRQAQCAIAQAGHQAGGRPRQRGRCQRSGGCHGRPAGRCRAAVLMSRHPAVAAAARARRCAAPARCRRRRRRSGGLAPRQGAGRCRRTAPTRRRC